ncbi:MAG TPA: hypothetical protein VG838_15495 [Opitutaceae bacterium]|nr:hypothetical protein [Opitutaceae bacterium]
MPQGDKSSYSSKQKRQAAHIEKSYESKGVGKQESKERAWRTVNKQTGGARGGARKRTARRSKSAAGRKAAR